jgi:hypothetical protein
MSLSNQSNLRFGRRLAESFPQRRSNSSIFIKISLLNRFLLTTNLLKKDARRLRSFGAYKPLNQRIRGEVNALEFL